MRQAFAHEAVLAMADDADLRAPGGAITVALCGHWEHEPPCPLAPHASVADRDGDEVRVRILFATEPSSESVVRQRIESALSVGSLAGPDGVTTRWELLHSQGSDVHADELEHAERLIRT
jgi:hypothetical protein